jgi:hypothetical protein
VRVPSWTPDSQLLEDIDRLIPRQRAAVEACLSPLVAAHYPALREKADNEYRKMLELSTKMSVVGRACSMIGGYAFDDRRLAISSLFGACCFLGDSFLDDFGRDASLEYLERFGRLLESGWFDVRTAREQLFYAVISRLFGERDVLDPMLRQAIMLLYAAQKQDVALRYEASALPRRDRLRALRLCARDRSGHAITVLSLFLVPHCPARLLQHLFLAGSLIMYIDDHGDCYYDRWCRQLTYMNQVQSPARTLRMIFQRDMARLDGGLPPGGGRDLLLAFLFRYYWTRLRKHRLERHRGASGWTVYE